MPVTERTAFPPEDEAAFRRVWAAQAVSQLGDAVYAMALPLIVYAATESATDMTVVYGLSMIPHVFFGLIGGSLSDRRGPRVTLVAAALAATACTCVVGVLIAAHRFDMLLLGSATVALATATSVLLPAFEAALPNVVAPHRLLHANGQLEASRVFTSAVGPVLAGLLVGGGAGPLAVTVNAVSFALAAALMGNLRALDRTTPARDPGVDRASTNLLRHARDGLSAAWANPTVRTGMLLTSGANVFAGLLDIYVIYALRARCGLSSRAVGAVFMLACLLSVALAAAASRLRRTMPLGQGMAVGLLGLSVSCVLMAVDDRAAVVAALLISIWAGMQFNMCWRALRQLACGPELIGRISGAARGVSYAGAALGSWLGGLLAAVTTTGVSVFFAIGAAVLLAFGFPARRLTAGTPPVLKEHLERV